ARRQNDNVFLYVLKENAKMRALQFVRIVSVVLLAGLCSCGIQPHRIAVGTTVASSDQIPLVLQTILDYDESGGKVPFLCYFRNNSSSDSQQKAAKSLLKSAQLVKQGNNGS